MKLVYMWVENYRNAIKNQEFHISDAYNISYDKEDNKLNISPNSKYVKNFYGENILDMTAIVGNNGAGKTTLSKLLYEECEGVHVSEDNSESINRIVVYEKENTSKKCLKELIVQYSLKDELVLENKNEEIVIKSINLKKIKGKDFENAEREHDITTVYFTNAFDVNNVLEQGFSEYSINGMHKSLCYSPMLEMERAYAKQKKHYGAENIVNGMIFSDINQYAEKMTTDLKSTYATSVGYNYLIAARHFPSTLALILPVTRKFEITIIEFGEYTENYKWNNSLSQFDKLVLFIRDNFYKPVAVYFENNLWKQIYLNILCEIILFISSKNGIKFNDKANTIENFLEQIIDEEEKKIVEKIMSIESLNLDILKEFLNLQKRNTTTLRESRWYKQIFEFHKNYDKLRKIKLDDIIDDSYIEFNEWFVKQYEIIDTIYGRMFKIIPPSMSSGEMAMINIFATVYRALKERTSESIMLILDEIDAFLHPEWQQKIMTYLTRWINESKEFSNRKVQLIIATHSPIILSDFLRNNIIYLKKPFEVVQNDNYTFGAGVGNLFYDSFFMEQGSIGNIARDKIQWVIDKRNESAFRNEEKEKIVCILNNIGDKFLREKLKSYPTYMQMNNDRK